MVIWAASVAIMGALASALTGMHRVVCAQPSFRPCEGAGEEGMSCRRDRRWPVAGRFFTGIGGETEKPGTRRAALAARHQPLWRGISEPALWRGGDPPETSAYSPVLSAAFLGQAWLPVWRGLASHHRQRRKGYFTSVRSSSIRLTNEHRPRSASRRWRCCRLSSHCCPLAWRYSC